MHDRLLTFVARKVADKRLAQPVTEDTSLIQSGLLDSVDLVDLAVCIEREMGSGVDLSDVDIAVAWDSVANICAFIEWHRNGAADRG